MDSISHFNIKQEDPDNTLVAHHDQFHRPDDGLLGYSPERAYDEVGQLLDTLEDQLKRINLHDLPMRKDVWQREFDRIQSQRLAPMLIAVCGVTGAGKSSLLNAVLDDNLVPTSGMSACTSVVTEIQYHDKETIVGEVEFLTLAEWKEELVNLFEEIRTNETEKSQKVSDPHSEVGAAWHKIRTVYPHLKPSDVAGLSADVLLQSEQHNAISSHFGSVQSVESPNSESFRVEISKYIESPRPRNPRRGRARGAQAPVGSEPDLQGAVWPLIRLVRIKSKSKALSSGVVLVDLPGIADANLARGKIAKSYMQTCDHIWVVSDIIRAVDEKAARDLLGDSFKRQIMNGNYNDHSITFIATKTDNVLCSEVIRELDLGGDPELQDIEMRIKSARIEEARLLAAKGERDKLIKEVKIQMNEQDPTLQIRAMNIGPIKGSNKRKSEIEPAVRDIKRICARSIGQDATANVDDMDVDHVDRAGSGFSWATSPSPGPKGTHYNGDNSNILQQGEDEGGNPRLRLQHLEEENVEAEVKILAYRKEVIGLEKQRKALCAMERNASSKETLQEDFRNGLEQLELDEEIDGGSSTSELERQKLDYSAVMLSVFTCSARDYTQMTKQLDSYGESTCFSNPMETEIPALQDRCHHLATKMRERTVNSLMSDLAVLLKGVEEFLRDAGGIDIHDCRIVAEKWSSEMLVAETANGLGLTQTQLADPHVDLPTPEPRKTRSGRRSNQRSTTPLEDTFERKVQQARDLDRNQRAIQQRRAEKGISHLLQKASAYNCYSTDKTNIVASKCQKHLQGEFRGKIRAPCQSGATTAKDTAIKTLEDSTQKMRWNTLRAILRRHGEFKEADFNAELSRPMTQRIMRPWSRIFEQNGLALLRQMAIASKKVVLELLEEVEKSSPPSLRQRFQAQCQLAYQEAEKSIDNVVENVGALIHKEQKIISRSLAPYIKTELRDTYAEIIEASGTGAGSGNRLKQNLHNRIDQCRAYIFSDACENMSRKLDRLAEGLGLMIRVALCELSDKVEVSIATVWDTPLISADDKGKEGNLKWKEELAIRGDIAIQVGAMLSQLDSLVQASNTA